MAYIVTVRDSLAPRGHFVEERDVLTKAEANAWVEQFKKEYSKEDGYTIHVREVA